MLAIPRPVIPWAVRARGTAKSSDSGMNWRVKNARLRNQSKADFF